MSEVISVRLSEDEELRIKAAAAVAGVPASGYLRWLMNQGRTQGDTETILRRLDSLGAAIANMSGSADRATPIAGCRETRSSPA